ncbi:DUF5937 family protein [Streptomyces sp. MS19]|uniref:DUF5937 family protein n=1 Tax=Streptomyces sp. MS19 TaxID=3385972 RepID=UPI0039A042DF
MTLRIHFTPADVARVRLADGPHPLRELAAAVRMLQVPDRPLGFAAWGRRALSGLDRRTRLLFDVLPGRASSADFLTTAEPGSVSDMLESVRRTPARRLRTDMERWAELVPRVPAEARRVGDDPRRLHLLVDVMEQTYERVVAPYWPRIAHLAAADRATRSRHFAEDGLEKVLNGLNPRWIRWRPPVLEVRLVSGHSGDVHLNGRGLLLIPTVFQTPAPTLGHSDSAQPWLSYPIDGPDAFSRPTANDITTARLLADVSQSLITLLGRTRARVLYTIAENPGSTTSEVARHLGISPASASEHATALRACALTDAHRDRNRILHTLTPAGTTLLNASTPTPQLPS